MSQMHRLRRRTAAGVQIEFFLMLHQLEYGVEVAVRKENATSNERMHGSTGGRF